MGYHEPQFPNVLWCTNFLFILLKLLPNFLWGKFQKSVPHLLWGLWCSICLSCYCFLNEHCLVCQDIATVPGTLHGHRLWASGPLWHLSHRVGTLLFCKNDTVILMFLEKSGFSWRHIVGLHIRIFVFLRTAKFCLWCKRLMEHGNGKLMVGCDTIWVKY